MLTPQEPPSGPGLPKHPGSARRIRLARLAWLLSIAFVAAQAAAGGRSLAGDSWVPLLPDQDFYDFQLFAPPDLEEYDIYPAASDGIFLNYDRIYMGITVPHVVGVGQTPNGGYLIPSDPISPQAIVQLNNGSIQASGTTGPNAGQSVIGGIYIFGDDAANSLSVVKPCPCSPLSK